VPLLSDKLRRSVELIAVIAPPAFLVTVSKLCDLRLVLIWQVTHGPNDPVSGISRGSQFVVGKNGIVRVVLSRIFITEVGF